MTSTGQIQEGPWGPDGSRFAETQGRQGEDGQLLFLPPPVDSALFRAPGGAQQFSGCRLPGRQSQFIQSCLPARLSFRLIRKNLKGCWRFAGELTLAPRVPSRECRSRTGLFGQSPGVFVALRLPCHGQKIMLGISGLRLFVSPSLTSSSVKQQH